LFLTNDIGCFFYFQRLNDEVLSVFLAKITC